MHARPALTVAKPAAIAGLALFLAVLFVSGCASKPIPSSAPTTSIPTPPAPPPARPTVTLQASPTFIQAGESTTLTWSSTNATALNLAPGVGNVAPQGSLRVTPRESMTYTLNASGPGGANDISVRITVAAAAVPQPTPGGGPAPTLEELFRNNVFDAYFDLDKADIRTDGRDALSKTAQFLRTQPQIRVVIEGHCDERGSTEYNLALGERRAQAARQFLISLGVDPGRMDTVSWGKERQFCTQSNEECWQQNRRAHFTLAR